MSKEIGAHNFEELDTVKKKTDRTTLSKVCRWTIPQVNIVRHNLSLQNCVKGNVETTMEEILWHIEQLG